MKEDRVMEDLSTRTAQEVLDHHLNLAEHFGAEEDWRRIVEKDLRRRNVSEDISSRYRDVYFREGLWTVGPAPIAGRDGGRARHYVGDGFARTGADAAGSYGHRASWRTVRIGELNRREAGRDLRKPRSHRRAGCRGIPGRTLRAPARELRYPRRHRLGGERRGGPFCERLR